MWRRAASPLAPLLAEQILLLLEAPDFAPSLQRRHRAALGLVAALPVRQRLSFASRNNAAASLPAPVVSFPSSPPFLRERETERHRFVRAAAPPFYHERVTNAAHLLSPSPHSVLCARTSRKASARRCQVKSGRGRAGKAAQRVSLPPPSLPKRLAVCLCKRRN